YPELEGVRHPVALYESAKNFLILPVLIWAIGKWEPGRGIVLSLFLFLYTGLRFAVDLFRDYEAAWLGIGTGQVFNLLMAAAGLIFLVWTIRHPRPVPRVPNPPKQAASWFQVAIFTILIIYPLGIPTSWTRANIIEKRQEAIEDARITAPIQSAYRL
ncbi:MAG TPA: prolipoprotein diacylglyceryl transferase family protein, partial [Paracoccaceae bacterium]|nr:prolipoprotein diacylglyceryl transferase family protein [Paracoccaceae bacterium]